MDVKSWLERYRRAWEDGDVDAVVELFTPNASYRSHILREPHVGSDVIRAYWEEATKTQHDIQVLFGQPLTEANRTAVEW